jgi:putative transcriptional regulator
MDIRHHIGDDTLMAYVNGTLTDSLSVVVATHLAICPKCRKSVELMEEMAGLFLMETETAGLSPSVKSMTGRIADLDPGDIQFLDDEVRSREYSNAGVPMPLAERMPAALDDIPWRTLIPGISHYPLPRIGTEKSKGTLRLLKIAPGKTMPVHSHSGQELTLILRGSYIDDLGRFQAGDIADLDSDIEHQPVADTAEDCICLIATDAPLKFSGFFSRLLQPVFGI